MGEEDEVKARLAQVQRELERNNERLRIQVGDDLVLTYGEDGEAKVYTTDERLLEVAVKTLIQGAEAAEKAQKVLAARCDLYHMALGLLHGWALHAHPDGGVPPELRNPTTKA